MPRTRFTPQPPIYTFRVRLRGFLDESGHRVEDVWREIEIAANQTLADLGNAIPLAFDFDDLHQWSFFLSGQAWDRSTEYALSSESDLLGGPRPHAARRVLMRDVPLPGATGKKEFLFLFDYGDEWHFGVKLVRISPDLDAGVRYPRVVNRSGQAPPQYPDVEDELDEGDQTSEN
jgi:hypothetical protein